MIGNSHQNALHDQNEAAALEAATGNFIALARREREEREATADAIAGVVRDSTRAQGSARVAAAGAGVSGASLELLLGDFERNELEFQTNQLRSLRSTELSLAQQREGVRAQTVSRIQSVPEANLFGSLLRIGTTAISASAANSTPSGATSISALPQSNPGSAAALGGGAAAGIFNG